MGAQWKLYSSHRKPKGYVAPPWIPSYADVVSIGLPTRPRGLQQVAQRGRPIVLMLTRMLYPGHVVLVMKYTGGSHSSPVPTPGIAG